MIEVLCVGGPLDGERHFIRPDIVSGDQVRLRVPELFDPERPFYLPWDDPRNAPVDPMAVYLFNGTELVAT